MTQAAINPELLRWARERSGRSLEELSGTFKKLADWETGESLPTYKQLEKFARAVYVPLGHLFLSEPPEAESLPFPDFRTREGVPRQQPSPNLLETVYQMQRRQFWMTEELIYQGAPPLEFVGAFTSESSPQQVAAAMREGLQLGGTWAALEGSWTNALQTLRKVIEAAGVMVFLNGVVGNNTSRKLDVDEFQGFALVDEHAPVIFINNADYKTAQIFTLAHELAHIFVGESGLSKFENLYPSDHKIERFCNEIAAEFLVPAEELVRRWNAPSATEDGFQEIARYFKVSTVVAARRVLDAQLITRQEFFDYYSEHKDRDWGGEPGTDKGGGGNFWNTQHGRVGVRFGSAVYRAVAEGRLTYTRAYRLTNLKGGSFSKMPDELGFQS